MRILALVAVALAVLGSCGGPDDSCEGQADPHCGHPIDRMLIPRLRALGVPIREAGRDPLCRRMAIDLLGRGPSLAELTACRGQTAAQMFDAFAATPDYLREQRRAWAELFRYDTFELRSEEISDLDRLVGEVYGGTIDYAEFARQIGMHPGLYGLHPDDSWTTYLWSLFLGRPARPDEIRAMNPLTRAWVVRQVCDGSIWWNGYKNAIDGGATEDEAIRRGHTTCYNVHKAEWGLNLCRCQPGLFGEGCSSNALGPSVQLTAVCPDPSDLEAPANFVRASDRSAGEDTCPDGSSRAECNDRLLDFPVRDTFKPLVPWAAPPPQLREELRQLGDALAARGDFWEAAVDREARKLLGWWQATFRQPESDLPEVRALLAAELRQSGSLRAVQKQLATSLLYTQPGEAPSVKDVSSMPPWVAGPTKLLAGEAWLATAAQAVGEVAGRCDFRWVSSGGYTPHWADPRQVEPSGGTLDAITYPGFSVASVVRLAGCSTIFKRPELSNLGLTFNQADLARTLCAYGRGVVPEPFTRDYAAAAKHLATRLWDRALSASEVDGMVTDMTACVAAGATAGCATPEVAVRWMCQRMIDSAEFATY